MAKTWNNPIDKNVDWGGDESTGGLPVSGEQVQKFIKDTLNNKAGLFYYDAANNRYLVFADEQNRDAYLNDPTQTSLIIATFDAPFNYMAEISLSTPTYNAIFAGTTGNYIDFTFDVKNKQGSSTGENVVITYTFLRNATKQVFSQVARHGESIHINIDKYLGEGVNTVIVGVTGQTTLAATTASITYQVVNLSLSDEMDISDVYDLTDGAKTLEVPFTVKGVGTKVVEWYLDGVLLDFVKNEDEVVEVETQRVKNIQLSNLQQGRHSLQFRAYTTINGEKFYTPTLYRDVIVYTGVSSETIVGLAMEIPVKYGLAGATPTLYGITQYIPYTLRFATYSPSNKLDVQVAVSLGDEQLGTISSNNGIVNEFSLVAKNAGSKTISLVAESVTYQIPAIVDATSMSIEEITSGLTLDFSAIGKSNGSADKDSWSFGKYKGTFSGFNWNNSSGWSNNRLKINDGASLSIDYAPLADSPTSSGRTLEFEFMTTNVNDDNAIICDLRNAEGYGLLITATKVTLVSEGGKVVENEFKANENVRLGIVINRSAGATRKGLSVIYANGCVSRCVNWESADSYASDAQISFVGTAGAEVELKSIRIYEAALSDDNMLNNYILYRDDVAEMLDVYDRNDIYVEGTTTFSPDKMVSRLPVMIVTGDIPVLENTSDKDTQIVVDIDYTDMQDPSRSFKMVGAAMRPQGTSSMGYPKKNFRIYTQKVADTIVYDADGKVVSDKLYSFKNGAIPVNCWCLKADYAESSGTHNTGIARMWNKALYNMQIDGNYVCRTNAQRIALEQGYPYDVRTTIDGFPILLFYRKNATDEPIFIGKYNFNNDKSTESVFGFTGIPGFDNSKMQCWEILNNGNPLALFQTIDGFDDGWKEAYESRYPDTKTPNTSDLKAFSTWMVGVNGDHERFASEKWQHLRIYPMAAYYCYLMRHAAADQLVKNAMLTSEDGQYWYFILYDNDTINGLINTGVIDILPTDNRESKDASGQYKFAGHSSVLWNMLEADEEFMQIVKDVDNALYSAGISYNECIRIFDEEQAEKWVERVYNQDSEYKYVGPYVNSGINNLEMLQGRRDLHRRWWLSKRFSIYDAKFVSGEYKSQAIEMKCQNDTPAGQSFTIKAGYPLDYGFGINNVPRETGVTLAVGDSHTFTTTEVVNLGDPIRIYGAPNIAELDLSPIANRLSVVNIANVYTEALGTRLEKLTVGGEGVNNVEVSEISGLKMAKKLTHLDIQGMRGIKALDLTSQPYFEELNAHFSEIASVSFTKGAPVRRLELPATMKSLNLEQLPYLTSANLVLENIVGIHTINVKGCPNLANDFAWIKSWYDSKATTDNKCTLIMDNVNWEGINVDDLVNIGKIGNLDLKGKVVVTEISLEQINALIDVFGESAFNRNSDFYINAPAAIFISGRNEIVEGESEQYSVIVFGAEPKRIVLSVVSGSNSYVNFDPTTGLLQVREGYGSGTITIRATILTDTGTQTSDLPIKINAIVYPSVTDTTIIGNATLEEEYETYRLNYRGTGANGKVSSEWTLTGLEGYAIIDSYNDESCVLKKLQEAVSSVKGTLQCTLKKKSTGDTLFTISKTIEVINQTIAEVDEEVCRLLYNEGLIADPSVVTRIEAAAITAEQLGMSSVQSTSIFANNANIKSFNGFKYFTNLKYVGRCFEYCTGLQSVTLPEGITDLGPWCFRQCKALTSLTLPNSLTKIWSNCFEESGIQSMVIPSKVAEIGAEAFYRSLISSVEIENPNAVLGQKCFMTSQIATITLPVGFKALPNYCFAQCYKLASITLPEGLTTIGDYCFQYSYIPSVELPTTLVTIGSYAFQNCTYLQGLKIPNGVSALPQSFCQSCTSLESVEIPSSVKRLGSYCFYGCTKLKEVVIPEGVEALESSCFQSCDTMTSLRLPSTITSWGSDCFNSCGKLENVTLADGLTSTGTNCFKNCHSLKEIIFPNSISTMGLGCLESCTSLERVTFPSGIKSIPVNCCAGCYALTSAIIPEGITTIPSAAFFQCKALASLDLPSTLAEIGGDVFYQCTKLKTITSRATVAPSVSTSAFGTSAGYYVGRDTYDTGNNMLYVPAAATGYESGAWLDPLCAADKCGFTLSKTL